MWVRSGGEMCVVCEVSVFLGGGVDVGYLFSGGYGWIAAAVMETRFPKEDTAPVAVRGRLRDRVQRGF